MKSLLVTGGAGFIGSTFCRIAVSEGFRVFCLDALTYAGNRSNISELEGQPSFEFIHGDIRNFELVDQIFRKEKLSGIVHFAAESHVDNSISGPQVFIDTNVNGTLQLLEASRQNVAPGADFKFVHVSTDEVFGQLGPEGKFSEKSPYAPNSPYSASKAASDFLVRAWNHTYKIPTVITNCSNNYGPRQHNEKLIPMMISQALAGKSLPVYGRGENIRDWIHVEDHCRGVMLAFKKGKPGAAYCFGGNAERKNIDVVNSICGELDKRIPRGDGGSYRDQISFVSDRLGHDFRYAIDDSLAQKELGFTRRNSFENGLSETIDWYLNKQNIRREFQREGVLQ